MAINLSDVLELIHRLLGHILINTYIPNSFKLRLKSASLYGYTQSGKCSKFACSKLNNNNNNNNNNNINNNNNDNSNNLRVA